MRLGPSVIIIWILLGGEMGCRTEREPATNYDQAVSISPAISTGMPSAEVLNILRANGITCENVGIGEGSFGTDRLYKKYYIESPASQDLIVMIMESDQNGEDYHLASLYIHKNGMREREMGKAQRKYIIIDVKRATLSGLRYWLKSGKPVLELMAPN
jgi:hypothetical protein